MRFSSFSFLFEKTKACYFLSLRFTCFLLCISCLDFDCSAMVSFPIPYSLLLPVTFISKKMFFSFKFLDSFQVILFIIQVRRETFQFRIRESSSSSTSTDNVTNRKIFICTIKDNDYSGIN